MTKYIWMIVSDVPELEMNSNNPCWKIKCITVENHDSMEEAIDYAATMAKKEHQIAQKKRKK